mgnify:CR=1 FL=1
MIEILLCLSVLAVISVAVFFLVTVNICMIDELLLSNSLGKHLTRKLKKRFGGDE